MGGEWGSRVGNVEGGGGESKGACGGRVQGEAWRADVCGKVRVRGFQVGRGYWGKGVVGVEGRGWLWVCVGGRCEGGGWVGER